jgi:hypothetical protein
MPSWELFDAQSEEYRAGVLWPSLARASPSKGLVAHAPVR